MKSVCLIAKGPSSDKANEWINEEDDIASINDAINANSMKGKNVKYLFFTHYILIKDVDPNRVETFVSPVMSLESVKNSPSWLLKERKHNHITYEHNTSPGDYDGIHHRIVTGGIAHYCTSTAAIHWLSKFGKYNKIRIIGIDGGLGYAKGVSEHYRRDQPLFTKCGVKFNPHIYDHYKKMCGRVSAICERVYGVKFEWYKNT